MLKVRVRWTSAVFIFLFVQRCCGGQDIAERVDIAETLSFVHEHFTSFARAEEMDWGVAHAADFDGSRDLDLGLADHYQTNLTMCG